MKKTIISIKKYSSMILSFLFPQEKVKIEHLLSLIQKRVLFHEKSFTFFLLPYKDDHVRSILKSLKFKNNKKVGKILGKILFDFASESLIDLDVFYNFKKPLIITIPLSKQRAKKRTYNQNDVIIESFMKSGGENFILWEKNNLIKSKDTLPQSRLSTKKERLLNPLDSFKLKKPQRISGKNIILFDDIYTTGATSKEAYRILKENGAKKILIMTIAR